MDAERKRVVDLINKELGDEFLRDWLRHLGHAYRTAFEQTREFDLAQMRKSYGHFRLAASEQSFKLLGRKYGLKLEDYVPPGCTYPYFTITTDSLVLTANRVSGPGRLPRKSFFRNTLATGTQYHVFENVASVQGRKFFNVNLLHNVERKWEYDEATGESRLVIRRDRPGFAVLAVPEREGKECIVRMPLFQKYPEVVAELRGVAVEDVKDQSKPTRRPKSDEQTETGSE